MAQHDTPVSDRPSDERLSRGGQSADVERLIADARGGSGESLGQLAERCRQYLLMIANAEMDHGLQSKVGASDVVQDALLKAQQAFGQFVGHSEPELRLWLRRILLNQLAHTWRSYYEAAKRSIVREQRIESWSVAGDPAALADDAVTPCRAAMAGEQTAAIERALDRLPQHYSQVIRLRTFDRLSFVEIGVLLQLSSDAARKLWCRAVDELRREWETGDESQ